MDKAKVLVYTGESSGMSSSAMGKALESAAAGKKVVVIQFLKGKGLADSALTRRLEPEIKVFRFERSSVDFDALSPDQQADEKSNILNGLDYARKVLSTAQCDVLILDQVMGLIEIGILTPERLEELLDNRMDTEVILTGRAMCDEVLTFADEITEIRRMNFRNYK